MAALLLLALPAPAQAYRPFDGTDADVASFGQVELELGAFGWLHQDRHNAVVAPALVANYGFLPRLELVLEGKQFVFTDAVPDQSRVQLLDTAISVKAVLRAGVLHDQSGPSVAVEGSVLLPETGASHPGGELAAIVSGRAGGLTVHGNLALAFTREGNAAGFVGVIVEGPATWMVRPVGEVFFARENPGATEGSALAGAIGRVFENLSLDAAVRLAHVSDGGATQTAWEGRLGLTWAFEVLGHGRRR
jgi:hypothetical protein